MIWFAMLIPLIGAVLLAVLFTKRIAWWEYLCIVAIPLIVIISAKQISIYSQIWDTEVWNNYVSSATYYEPWDEYIHQTCTRTYACGSDSKGNTEYCTETYDCSYVQYHPAEWVVCDNSGDKHSVSRQRFEQICNKFNNRYFVNMHRDYHSIDGDAYKTDFGGQFSVLIPITTKHTYENRIQCSKSVFNFQEVDSLQKKELFDYPPITLFDYNPILGWRDTTASSLLQRTNALYGTTKKLHMMIVVFKNKPIETALLQEALWKGGNKNEFILMLSVKDSTIQWARVTSWTDVDILKVRVARHVSEMKFSLPDIVKYLSDDVPANFVKKNFREFSYISVEPTDRALISAFIIVFVLTIGWMVFSVRNKFNIDGEEYC